ncbi:hypothetical protein COE15_09345 [Bacillus cereus]|nr:hypothetical protein CN288_13560 [Bacillus sp. AFS023182]PGY02183.1 hypothetical protein COE15_09345 [Bacillus cereus]
MDGSPALILLKLKWLSSQKKAPLRCLFHFSGEIINKNENLYEWGIFLVIIFSVPLIYRAEKLYNLYQRGTGNATPDC